MAVIRSQMIETLTIVLCCWMSPKRRFIVHSWINKTGSKWMSWRGERAPRSQEIRSMQTPAPDATPWHACLAFPVWIFVTLGLPCPIHVSKAVFLICIKGFCYNWVAAQIKLIYSWSTVLHMYTLSILIALSGYRYGVLGMTSLHHIKIILYLQDGWW